MKKSILISIFAFAIVAISCSKIYDVSEPEVKEVVKSKELIDQESAYYATVVRNMIRFNALNEQFNIDQIAKVRVGGNDKQSIIDSKVNELFENMRQTKGDDFVNNAKKMYANPLLKNPASLNPIKVVGGSKKKDLGNRTVEVPLYLLQYITDFEKHVISKVDKYAERIEKKSDVNESEYINFVKSTISDFEDKVIKDKKLTQDQRAEIFTSTSFCYANAETICKVSVAVLEDVTNTKGMRVKGFFRSLIRIFGTIIHDVIVGAVIGLVIDAAAGLLGFTLVGGAVGLVWGIIDVIQGDCTCMDLECDGGCQSTFYSCPC